jgi:membrane protease YdiL (CAAX protease family)
MNSFWSPWKEDKSAMKLALIIGIFMVLLLFGFKTIFQNNPPEYARADIYLGLLIFAVVLGIMDWITKAQTTRIIEYVQFGSIQKLIISGMVGIVFALLITSYFFTVVPGAPTATFSTVPPFLTPAFLNAFYIIIVAAYVEEKFFACLVAPTTYKIFGGVLGLIITCGAFAFYHGYAYGWDYNLMLGAGIWRGAVLIGNQFFQSTGFSFLAHITNNARAIGVI